MYTNTDFDNMKEKLISQIGDIDIKMGRIHAMVNNYVEPHVYTDITNRTINTMYDPPTPQGPLL